ncbi:hypothetical protein AA0117_g8367 [Alternaria alternata]|uniref:Uncharacterized protein n=1 Tax=Alternaria alternata TaxID=5599 RepID=A0A4Q4N9F9_ALTAL|nr:hypothetical protein AA0117_g8367 [Alternaria alternata]
MDSLKRARVIKSEIEKNISVLTPEDKKVSTRRNDDEDPENVAIKSLRQEQKWSWNEIADHLNQERLNKGEAAIFTETAVYSRYVRVISKAGKKRIKDYDNATELKANIRQPVTAELQDKGLEEVEKTEQLMKAVAKCERNFWKYVADEMERATTKMYDPEELASRFHAI